MGSGGECAQCRRRRLARSAHGASPAYAPPIVHDVLRAPGQPLEPALRGRMEARFGHDFSRVRVHTDVRAAESARAVAAHAYTVGQDVVFDAGRYAPGSAAGQSLLVHELTHVVQQGGQPASGARLSVAPSDDAAEREARRAAVEPAAGVEPAVRRDPTFPDATCDHVKSNIERAWPSAKSWVSHARRRLSTPADVSGALGTHFRLDPNDTNQATDLSYVQRVFARMEEIFDLEVPQVCTPPNAASECRLPDGRRYGAFVTGGVFQITYCTRSADVGLLGGQDLIALIVHEVSHLADASSTDWAYRHEAVRTSYRRMTRAQAILNADSYAELARDLYLGGAPRNLPIILSGGVGALLSAQRPRWVVTAGYDVRSRSGLEVFDLVGGLRGFISVTGGDSPHYEQRGPAVGASLDFGVISRSAQTSLFVDTRVGAFLFDDPKASGAAAGVSARALIGWASSGFRTGVDLRLLYDAVNNNNAVIIGVELGVTP
jgi:hypothetical protein